jgi:peptidoglycan hydrolase CwlO-like protein
MNKRLGIIIIALLLILFVGFGVKSQLTIKALSESIEELQFEQENLRGKIYAIERKSNSNESALSDLEGLIQDIDERLTNME